MKRRFENPPTTALVESSAVAPIPAEPIIQVLSVVEGLATAITGPTCLLQWRGVVNESRFRLQRDAIELVTSRHPGAAAVLCIIEPTSEPPPQALREAASALLTALAPKLCCVAYVIEGGGFRAATIRGVLSGIEFLRRNSYPVRYFASVEEAAGWMATITGQRRSELILASRELVRRLDAHA